MEALEPTADEEPGPKFPPEIQAILTGASARRTKTVAHLQAHFQAQQRLDRAVSAWQRVDSCGGDTIPIQRTRPAADYYVDCLMELGEVLVTDGWQDRVAAVDPGPDAKTYALQILRCAMQGDRNSVSLLVSEAIAHLFELGIQVRRWLDRGLQDEVLGFAPDDPSQGNQADTGKPLAQPTATPQRKTRSSARDKWLYQRCHEVEKTYKQIQAELSRRCRDRGWRCISSAQGILAAARKYARENDLPMPPARQNL